MKTVKLFTIFFLILIFTMGACGCMEINESNYDADIKDFLNAKYNEQFIIKDMSREVSIGSNDKIYASCYSEKYPNELFDVYINLSIYDVYGKKEIVDVLNQAGVYEGELETPEGYESLIEDNYINVVLQNKVDEGISVSGSLFVKTQITTPNFLPTVTDKNIGVDEFFEMYSDKAVLYTSVFVDDENKLTDEFKKACEEQITKSVIKDHLILYYVTDLNSSEIKELYMEHYEDNNEYFYDAETTKKYIVEKYSFGIKD